MQELGDELRSIAVQERDRRFGRLVRGEATSFRFSPEPLRAPGRLLQGSFSLEVSLALVGVNYLPGLFPILVEIVFGINQKMYIIFGRQ
jgi:hypothetical protein